MYWVSRIGLHEPKYRDDFVIHDGCTSINNLPRCLPAVTACSYGAQPGDACPNLTL